jgi:hypothetical protein
VSRDVGGTYHCSPCFASSRDTHGHRTGHAARGQCCAHTAHLARRHTLHGDVASLALVIGTSDGIVLDVGRLPHTRVGPLLKYN